MKKKPVLLFYAEALDLPGMESMFANSSLANIPDFSGSCLAIQGNTDFTDVLEL